MERPAGDEKEFLLAQLEDLGFCAKYLSASLRESPETFLMALRNVAKVQKGMTKLSSEAGLNRESMYTMLSDEGNPRLESLLAVMAVLGIHFSVVVTGRDKGTAPDITELVPSELPDGLSMEYLVAKSEPFKNMNLKGLGSLSSPPGEPKQNGEGGSGSGLFLVPPRGGATPGPEETQKARRNDSRRIPCKWIVREKSKMYG